MSEIEQLRDENRRLRSIVAKLPKTADGVQFRDGLEVWFLDLRKWSDGNRWNQTSKHDGEVIANGILRFDGYEWSIDKDTQHNRELCQPFGNENFERAMPCHYAGDTLRDCLLYSTREAALAASIDEVHHG